MTTGSDERAGVGPDRAGQLEARPVSGISRSVIDQRDLAVATEDRQRLAAIARGRHRVAGRLQDAALKFADREGVLDDEDLRSGAGGRAAAALAGTLTPRRPRVEHGRLDQQRDPAVAEDRRAEVARHVGKQRPERLDHDLFLAHERVADHDRPAAAGGDDERRRTASRRRRLARRRAPAKSLDRQRPAPYLQRRPGRPGRASGSPSRPLPPRRAAPRRRPRRVRTAAPPAARAPAGAAGRPPVPRPGSLLTSRLPPRDCT